MSFAAASASGVMLWRLATAMRVSPLATVRVIATSVVAAPAVHVEIVVPLARAHKGLARSGHGASARAWLAFAP
jgi:hypothetical protein